MITTASNELSLILIKHLERDTNTMLSYNKTGCHTKEETEI